MTVRAARLCLIGGVTLAFGFPGTAFAAAADSAPQSFLWVAIILIAAKLGALVERIGQPLVLGEILVGVALGSLAYFGVGFPDAMRDDPIVAFLAELGAVILLFQIGLESNVSTMRRVGVRAFLVAVIGVVVPFVLGTYLIGPWLLPGLSNAAYLFLGAALTATSVGITGRVFRDAGVLQRSESQIVLGAAVIDDVLGLVILAVVASIAASGAIEPAKLAIIVLQAVGFLVGALLVGQLAAPALSRVFARIHRGPATKLTIALSICFTLAYLAHVIGLAPIVGAFAAGLILEEVHFKDFASPTIRDQVLGAVAEADERTRLNVHTILDHHRKHHLEHLVEPVAHFVVPVFFVVAGLQVRLDALASPGIIALAVAITAAAIVGKLVSGIAAGPTNRWLVGWGMVPRGEVGLIFAFVGSSMGVLDAKLFSLIVFMVLVTTLVTPPVLVHLLRRESRIPQATESLAPVKR